LNVGLVVDVGAVEFAAGGVFSGALLVVVLIGFAGCREGKLDGSNVSFAD